MNATEMTEEKHPFTTQELSDLIENLHTLFSKELVAILPDDCVLREEQYLSLDEMKKYQGESLVDSLTDDDSISGYTKARKVNTDHGVHLSIRSAGDTSFRIFDSNNILWNLLGDSDEHTFNRITALIFEYALKKIASHAGNMQAQVPWVELKEDSTKWLSHHDCLDIDIFMELCGTSGTDWQGQHNTVDVQIIAEPIQRDTPKELKLLSTWNDLSVRLVSDDSIKIKIGSAKGREYLFGELGFADMRKGRRTPKNGWDLLVLLAENNGSLKVGEHTALSFSNRAKTEKSISNLQKNLRELFDIEEKAIVGNKIQGTFEYRCAFPIQDQRQQQA